MALEELYIDDYGDTDYYTASDDEEVGAIPRLSVLEKLKFTRARNIQLQADLEYLLALVDVGLKKNAKNWEKVRFLTVHQAHQVKCGIFAYMKQIKYKIPYFVDFSLKTPPNNSDVLDRGARPSDIYLSPVTWSPVDEKKLKIGVKCKNLELLSIPLHEQMTTSDVSLNQLESLEEAVRNLRHRDEKELLKYSPHIDWVALAYEQFNLEHQTTDCRLHYKNYLNPDINKTSWTQSEQRKLMDLVEKYNQCNWLMISNELGSNRTPLQCIQYYRSCMLAQLAKEWTPIEEMKLKDAINIYGCNWGMVANYVGSRTSQQCTSRYCYTTSNVVAPKAFKFGTWKNDEIQRLHEGVNVFGSTGNVWGQIAEYVGTRNATQCRERYRNVSMGQHLIRPWTEEETKRLMEYANERLRDGQVIGWAEISREVNHRDDTCRRHWFNLSSPEDQAKLKVITLKMKEYQKRLSKKKKIKRKPQLPESTSSTATDVVVDVVSDGGEMELEEYRNNNTLAEHETNQNRPENDSQPALLHLNGGPPEKRRKQ